MPITIDSNQVKIKTENGQYITLNAVADATTEEKVAEISAAGAAQIAAINTKTQQSLAQISTVDELEDMIAEVFDATKNYSAGDYVIQEVNGVNELYRFTVDHTAGAWIGTDAVAVVICNDITDIKNVFNRYDNGIIPLNAIWIRASINANGTLNTNTTWRLSTENMCLYDRAITFTIDSGYTVQIAIYDTSDQFIGRNVIPNGYTLASNTKFRISIYKSSETTSDDPTLFYRNVNIHSAVDDRFNLLQSEINKTNRVNETIINYTNYETLLPDVNSITENSIHFIVPTSAGAPLNLPAGLTMDTHCMLITTTPELYNGITRGGTYQILYCSDGKVWVRSKSNTSTWREWSDTTSKKNQITVSKDGTGDFTSFTAAVRYARNSYGTTIYVNAGTYDLAEEMIAVYPTYFSNYNAADLTKFPDNRGLSLGWGMKIICSPNARFVCNRTTDDAATQSYSPIYTDSSDFELIGFNLECALVRYGIHDDPYKDNDEDYKKPRYLHIYENCHIKVDNSESTKTFRACIGGGYGYQANVIIRNSTFESVGVANDRGIVTFHNCPLDNAQSSSVVTGCYFKTGTCGTTWYGPSEKISTMMVSNNRLKSQPYVRAEAAATYNVENVELLAWNNTIN